MYISALLDNRVHTEPVNRNNDDYALERVIEENESEIEEMSTKSSSVTSDDEQTTEIIRVDVVNIRPSTAPGSRILEAPPTSGTYLETVPPRGCTVCALYTLYFHPFASS